jgi:hypothetical protein
MTDVTLEKCCQMIQLYEPSSEARADNQLLLDGKKNCSLMKRLVKIYSRRDRSIDPIDHIRVRLILINCRELVMMRRRIYNWAVNHLVVLSKGSPDGHQIRVSIYRDTH